jgi:hypothetical protein
LRLRFYFYSSIFVLHLTDKIAFQYTSADTFSSEESRKREALYIYSKLHGTPGRKIAPYETVQYRSIHFLVLTIFCGPRGPDNNPFIPAAHALVSYSSCYFNVIFKFFEELMRRSNLRRGVEASSLHCNLAYLRYRQNSATEPRQSRDRFLGNPFKLSPLYFVYALRGLH